MIAVKFTIEEDAVLNTVRDTQHLLNECIKSCNTLENRLNSLQKRMDRTSGNHEPNKSLNPTMHELNKIKHDFLSLSDKVTYLFNENKKIVSKITNTWQKRLLNLLSTGFRVTKLNK